MAVPINFNQSLDLSGLRGRSVLVTGAASGIGLACAAQIAEAGALVTISDLQAEIGQTVVKDLVSRGYSVQFVQCDVTSYEAQRAIQFGRGKIDIVIPNAGVIAEKNLFDIVTEEPPTLDSPPPTEPGFVGANVNLRAVYNTCFLALHYFRLPRNTADTLQPSIVLISSLAGYVGYPSSTTYSISKFGVRGLFYGIRDRASRCSPPVRINLVAPWYIETAMTKTPDFLESEAGLLLKVMGFAPMERVVDAVVRFSVDENLHGRAAGVFPLVNDDLGDDFEGSYGGQVLHKHMSDVMAKVVQAMANMDTNALARQDSANA